MGRSIDTTQTATLVTSALDMAIRNRGVQPGVVTHSDHGAKPRLTPWAFAGCAHASVLVPSFWARMHHRRRHSALGMLSPAKYDLASIPGAARGMIQTPAIQPRATPATRASGLAGRPRPRDRSHSIIGTRHFLVVAWHRLASQAVGFCELGARSFTGWIEKRSRSSAMFSMCQNRLADVVT